MLGSFSKSWMPVRICLTVMDGFHPSSLIIDKHILPEGYAFGCWKPFGNRHSGAECGYASLNIKVTGYKPPSQAVPGFPGILQSHCIQSIEPSLRVAGLATKPKGWSFLQFFLSVASLLLASPPGAIATAARPGRAALAKVDQWIQGSAGFKMLYTPRARRLHRVVTSFK